MTELKPSRILRFELRGKNFGIDVSDLTGVTDQCSFLSYDGLPNGVQGIVHFAGKVFPVLDLDRFFEKSELTGEKTRAKPMFLFSSVLKDGKHAEAFKEVALAVYSDVHMTNAERKNEQPKGAPSFIVATAQSVDGESFEIIDLQKLIDLI